MQSSSTSSGAYPTAPGTYDLTTHTATGKIAELRQNVADWLQHLWEPNADGGRRPLAAPKEEVNRE